MSYASDFGHDIPPDDWTGDYGRWRYKARYHYNYTNYNRKTELCYQEIVTETEKAYLFKCKEGKVWIPKSRIESLCVNALVVYIPLWLYNRLEFFNN